MHRGGVVDCVLLISHTRNSIINLHSSSCVLRSLRTYQYCFFGPLNYGGQHPQSAHLRVRIGEELCGMRHAAWILRHLQFHILLK